MKCPLIKSLLASLSPMKLSVLYLTAFYNAIAHFYWLNWSLVDWYISPNKHHSVGSL